MNCWGALFAILVSACDLGLHSSAGASAAQPSIASIAAATVGGSASKIWGTAAPPKTPDEETRAIARIWSRHLPAHVEMPPRTNVCDAFETSRDRETPARDAWGTPLDVQCDRDGSQRYVMRSAGADRHFGTADDIVVTTTPGYLSGFAGPPPLLNPPRGTGPRPAPSQLVSPVAPVPSTLDH